MAVTVGKKNSNYGKIVADGAPVDATGRAILSSKNNPDVQAPPSATTVRYSEAPAAPTGTTVPSASSSSAVTPPPTAQTSSSAIAPPVTRYTSAADTAFGKGGALSTAPVDESKIRRDLLLGVQPQIDSVNEMMNVELAAARERGTQNLGKSRAVANATGVLGSPTGDTYEQGARDIQTKEESAIRAAGQERIASLNANVASRADQMIQNARSLAQTNSAAYLTYLKEASTKALADMKDLATAGAELSPDTKAKLLEQTGYDEDTFDSLYQSIKIANSNDYINKDKPEIIGNNAIFFKRVTGPDGKMQIVQESVPLPEGQKEIQGTVSRDDGIYFLYKDGSYSKVGQPSSGYVAPGQEQGGYNGEFEATIKRAAQQGGTNAQRSQIASDLKEYIANGDYKSAYTQVVDATAKGLGGTVGNSFREKVTQADVTSDLKRSLEALKAAGYDTNKLKGGADKIQTALGLILTDPKYATAATELDLAFQSYRQIMTGAAFGAQESAEYSSVLPGKGNTFELNMAKIAGLSNYLRNSTNSSIRQVVGDGGVHIREYAEGATPPAGPADASDEQVEIDGQLYEMGSSGEWIPAEKKNSPVSLNRPQRNNNPGNVKIGGIADSYAAKNPDGSPKVDDEGHLVFASPADGKKALAADLEAKVNGKSQHLAKANPTIAELGAVYAQDPNWPISVAKILGVTPDTKTKSVDFTKLFNAVTQQEGYFA